MHGSVNTELPDLFKPVSARLDKWVERGLLSSAAQAKRIALMHELAAGKSVIRKYEVSWLFDEELQPSEICVFSISPGHAKATVHRRMKDLDIQADYTDLRCKKVESTLPLYWARCGLNLNFKPEEIPVILKPGNVVRVHDQLGLLVDLESHQMIVWFIGDGVRKPCHPTWKMTIFDDALKPLHQSPDVLCKNL